MCEPGRDGKPKTFAALYGGFSSNPSLHIGLEVSRTKARPIIMDFEAQHVASSAAADQDFTGLRVVQRV